MEKVSLNTHDKAFSIKFTIMEVKVNMSEEKKQSMLTLLEKLVNIDSGSYDKEGVDWVGDVLREEYKTLGFEIDVRENPTNGNNLVIRHKDATSPEILLVAHMDTVFPKGTAANRPFHIEGERAYGPGVIDMKSSLVSLLFAVQSLQEKNDAAYKNIEIILNSDEEIGSPTSKELIQERSKDKTYALVMEPARANGAIVSSRRGGGGYTLTVTGKAAHSGVAPEEGVSAIEELAHKIIELEKLNDHEKGISINVGIIKGGAATNMIPDQAVAEIDVRITYPEQGGPIEEQIESICSTSTVPGTTLSLSGGINRPPLHLNEQSKELLLTVQEIGKKMGLNLDHVHTGGGSDASFPSALGVATIDGLGPVGGELHNEKEYLEIPTLTERCSLLEKIISNLS